MEHIKSLFKYDPVIYKDLSVINIHRIHRMAWIMGLVNIVHIGIFWSNIPSDPDYVVVWYKLVVAIHGFMLFYNGILGLLSYWIEKKGKQSHKTGYLTQCCSIVGYLVFGIFLCVSDQLVTANINPLFIACLGIGILFVIPPILSAVIYLLTFLLFFNVVTLTQQIPELLVDIRINSVSASIMGFGVSWILWRTHLLRRQQQNIIEDQKRILEEKNKHLEILASHDPLTGLLNRTYFREFVDKRIMHHGSTDCFILLDIDFFKVINDNYGHPAGDKILIETAKIITSTLERSDTSARLGGEEFIILLPETNIQIGREIAEELRRKIQDYSFQFEGHLIDITASFGIAMLGNSFDICYSQADKALYKAKTNGRNCLFIAEM